MQKRSNDISLVQATWQWRFGQFQNSF